MPENVKCIDVDGNWHEVGVEELSWRPSAYGIVIKDDALLLSKQFNGYDLPGGGVDLGETLEEAVLREIKEETGIIADNPRILEVKTSFFKMPRKTNIYVESIMFYFVCDYVGGEFSIDGFDEHEREYADWPEWVKIEDLAETKMDRSKIANSIDWRPFVKRALELTT